MNDPTVIVTGWRALKLGHRACPTRWRKFRFILRTTLAPLQFPAFVFHELCHIFMMVLCKANYFTYDFSFMRYTANRACNIESKKEVLVNEVYCHYGLSMTMIDLECPMRSFLIAFAPFFGHMTIVGLFYILAITTDSKIAWSIYMYIILFPSMFLPSEADRRTGYSSLYMLQKIRKEYPSFIAFLSSFRKADNQNAALFYELISKTSPSDQKCHKS